jgi:hypothetical protein
LSFLFPFFLVYQALLLAAGARGAMRRLHTLYLCCMRAMYGVCAFSSPGAVHSLNYALRFYIISIDQFFFWCGVFWGVSFVGEKWERFLFCSFRSFVGDLLVPAIALVYRPHPHPRPLLARCQRLSA